MGKVEEQKERWYKADWGEVSLTAINTVQFTFNGEDPDQELPLNEWNEIVRFIRSESRRK